jgi:hypothetical protein
LALDGVSRIVSEYMSDREHIPNELQRLLMLEVGYRCPLCKQTEPLEFEHIEEYADVRRHEFTNMIVLCASCHGRKKDSSNPRHINRASLKKLKQNLMLLNGRYSDLERRVLEEFQDYARNNPNVQDFPALVLPDTMMLLVKRLADDRFVTIQRRALGHRVTFRDGITVDHAIILIALTPSGISFIDHLNAARSI